MKKVYLLFGLLLSLLLIGVVKAEGPFYLDFDFKPNGTNAVAVATLPYNDGYLAIDYINNTKTMVLTSYDIKGNKLDSKTYPNVETILDYLTTDSGTFLMVEFTDEGYHLIKLDDKMNFKENKSLGSEGGSPLNGAFIYDAKDSLLVSSFTSDGNSPYEYRSYKKDLSSYEELNENEAIAKAFSFYDTFDVNKFINYFSNTSLLPALGDPNKSNVVILAMDRNCPYDSDDCNKYFLLLFNNNAELLWKVAIPKGYYGAEVKYIDDYIAVSVEGGNFLQEGKILIYDIKGNLIQTMQTKEEGHFNGEFDSLRNTPRGFAVVERSCISNVTANPTSQVQKDMYHLVDCQSSTHHVYYFFHQIITKVTQGKGKIQVIDRQIPGEPVEFIITPDPGYVLGSVKVTDANGNVVYFTSNRFTMPSADVTIEVEFLVANAKTGDIAITMIIILAILTASVTVIQYRRLKALM